MEYVAPNRVNMTGRYVRIVVLYIHFDYAAVSEMLLGMFFHAAVGHSAKEEVRKFHREEQPIQDLFLDSPKCLRGIVNRTFFPKGGASLERLWRFRAREGLVLCAPVTCEIPKGLAIFAEPKFEIAKTCDWFECELPFFWISQLVGHGPPQATTS